MPTLVKDTAAYTGGNKNTSIGGGWNFSSDGIPDKSWTEVYYIIGDTPHDTEDTILGTTGLPILGQPNRQAWCTSRIARCIDDSAMLWEVTCLYKSDVSIRVKTSTEERYPDEYPGIYYPIRLDLIPAVIDWTSETIQEPLIRDAQDLDETSGELKLVTNTMKEPLYPPVERTLIVLNADWFMPDDERIYSYNWSEEFTNRVNATSFMGIPEGCVLCTSLDYQATGELPYYAGMMPEDPNTLAPYPPNFYHFRAQFKIRFWYTYSCVNNHLMPDPSIQGWILKLLNVGNTMKKKKRPDQPSNPETERVGAAAIDKAPIRANLDMDGYPLDPTEEPIWLEWNRYPSTDLDALLDPSILPSEVIVLPDVPGPSPCT